VDEMNVPILAGGGILLDWLGMPLPRGTAILLAVLCLCGWAWLYTGGRRMEARHAATRRVLAAVLDRERARGEVVLGREDALAVLQDLRRIAAKLPSSPVGDDEAGSEPKEKA